MTGAVPSCEPEVHLAETGARMAAVESLGRGRKLDPLPLHHRGVARQRVLQSMRTLKAGKRESVPGTGHGNVVQAARLAGVLALSQPAPAAVQHGDMVELQSLGAVRALE